MSIRVMTIVWENYPGKNGELLLALKLADAANDDGTAIFKKVDTLARLTRMSVRAVQSLLRRMEETGFLVVTKHAQGGRGHAREYSVNPRWLANPLLPLDGALKSADDTLPETLIKGAESAPFILDKGCRFQQERVHAVAPFTDASYIRNPSIVRPVISPRLTLDGFDLFWRTWPVSPNKRRKKDCERLWVRGKFEREREAIQRHLHATVIGSPQALRDGGQYLVGPKSYLTEQAWRDPVEHDQHTSRPRCHCGADAPYQLGHLHLCQMHYDEECSHA